MRRLLLSSALICAAAAPAFSGGTVPVMPSEPVTMPQPVPSYDWTGFSAGIALGYADMRTNVAGSVLAFDTDDRIEGDGGLYGVSLAYDRQFGRFVIGAGIDYLGADVPLEVGEFDILSDVDTLGRAGLRAGIGSGRNMYYLTGGYAKIDLDDRLAEVSFDSSGYFVGAGYEAYVSNNVTIGTEVLYHEFDDFGLGGLDLEADVTTVGLSMNYRF